jgi:alanine racemase
MTRVKPAESFDRRMPMVANDPVNAVLTIDVDAIVDNWRSLRARAAPARCAAVVKANAYGLGASKVVPALVAAGCRDFFVATIDEGVALRQWVGEARIAILGAPVQTAPAVFSEHDLTPVLNSLGDIEAWARHCEATEQPHPAMIHIDSGMSRLGLPPDEIAALVADPTALKAFSVTAILSHLACADDPSNSMNDHQLSAFRVVLADLPPAPASLANSGGIFLGPDFRFDLVRPGIALYGGASSIKSPNPMKQVIHLQGRILQIRQIDSPQTVGYGAIYRAPQQRRIATVGVGYADGYLRALSNRSWCSIAGRRAPLVGRVSMDLITFDVSNVPETLAPPGTMVDLIGPDYRLDEIADDAGTIGYEILTALGTRYRRVYAPLTQTYGD